MKKILALLCIVPVILLSLSCSKDKTKSAKVRLAYLQGDLHQLACWIALEKNFFKEEGVDAEVAGIFKAGPEEMSAFAAGSLDVGYVGQAPATTAVANGAADVTVLAQVNKEGSAIVVRKDSALKKPGDLEGKTVAVPGHSTVQDFLLRKALTKYGIDEKKVSLIVLKPPEMIGALKTGQIDAFIAWEPYPAKAVTMNVGRNLITSRDIWKDHQCCVLVADSKFIGKSPGIARGIVKAHVRATQFIKDYPEEAVKIAVKYTAMDEKTISKSMDNIKYDCLPEIKGEIEYVEFLSKLGYIKVKDAAAFTEKFIDAGILKEIIK